MDIEKIQAMSDEEIASQAGVPVENVVKDREAYVQESKHKTDYLLACIQAFEKEHGSNRITAWTSALLCVQTQLCLLLAQAAHIDLTEQSKQLDDLEQIALHLIHNSFKTAKQHIWKVKNG